MGVPLVIIHLDGIFPQFNKPSIARYWGTPIDGNPFLGHPMASHGQKKNRRVPTPRIGYILIIAILGTSISVVVVAEFLMYTSDYHNIKDDGMFLACDIVWLNRSERR